MGSESTLGVPRSDAFLVARERKNCTVLTFPCFLPATIPCRERYPGEMLTGRLFPRAARRAPSFRVGDEGVKLGWRQRRQCWTDGRTLPGRQPGRGARRGEPEAPETWAPEPAGTPWGPREPGRGVTRPPPSLPTRPGLRAIRVPSGRPGLLRPLARGCGRADRQPEKGQRSTVLPLGSGRGSGEGLWVPRRNQLRTGA